MPNKKRTHKKPKKIGEEPRPNKHTHRVAWNEYFEKDIARKYGGSPFVDGSRLLLRENSPQVIDAAKCIGIAQINIDSASRTQELIRVEGLLISLAMEKMIYGNFEEEWNGLDIEKKKEIALEGLYRGACLAPRDNSRVNCPEMTIEGLIGTGEFNLINLLKRLIAHDPVGSGKIQKLFLFKHPLVNNEYRVTDKASDVVKAFIHQCNLYRNWYIVATLKGTLEAFYNIAPEQIVPVATFGASKTKEQKRACRKHSGSQDAMGIHVDQSQCEEEAAIKSYACWTCYSRTNDRTTLQRCSQCNLVWYCSAECQAKDWKEHKKICGKQNFDPEVLSPTPEVQKHFIGCPEPVPGFFRSPALTRQIWYLSKPDSVNRDYHFNLKYDRTRSLVVRDQFARLTFLIARRRALASGNIPAVHMMYKILKLQNEVYGDGSEIGKPITIAQIHKQFELEYKITINAASIEAADAAWVPPTMKEINEEHIYLKRRMEKAGEYGLRRN